MFKYDGQSSTYFQYDGKYAWLEATLELLQPKIYRKPPYFVGRNAMLSPRYSP